MANVELSKAQVRKAGQTLRRFMRSGQTLSAEESLKFDEAIVVVQQFRAAHQHPLVTANNGLRSMVRTAGCEVEVSQRLKRLNTILDKLVREPNLPLSSMQDIGGVRAVLNSIDEVRRVEARLKHNRLVDSSTIAEMNRLLAIAEPYLRGGR